MNKNNTAIEIQNSNKVVYFLILLFINGSFDLVFDKFLTVLRMNKNKSIQTNKPTIENI